MIAYVILIVIAITLSIGVYTWLKVYVPKPGIECPVGASLIIRDVVCNDHSVGNNEVKITFENKGLFDVDGAYIRIGNSQTGRDDGRNPYNPVWEIEPIGGQDVAPLKPGFFYFIGERGFRAETGERSVIFDYGKVYEGGGKPLDDNAVGIKKIQIIPFVLDRETNEIALCEDATVTRSESCS